jgi:PAS domain S-box-containing protein
METIMPQEINAEPVESLRKELKKKNAEHKKLSEALKESEDRYSRMLDNLKGDFLFYRHDIYGKFTFISPSYERILGFAPEDYIGLSAGDLWTPNPINKAANRHTLLSCQGVRQPPYEMEIFDKSGVPRRFETIETPILDEWGQVVAVEGTARDITEKRKVEEQLEKYRLKLEDLVQQRTSEVQASKKQLADIIDFIPDPIYVVDTNGLIIAWNRAMASLTGTPRDTALGQGYKTFLGHFFDFSDPSLIQMALTEELERDSGKTFADEEKLEELGIQRLGDTLFAERHISSLNQGDGGYVWISVGPILDSDNRIAGVIASLRDVTNIRRAEIKVKESERRLSTLMGNLPGMAYRIFIENRRWQVEFVSGGSHQIFGYEPSYFVGRNLSDLKHLVHPEDLDRLVEKAILASEKNKLFECEYRIFTASGETKWVFDKAVAFTNQTGGSSSIEGFMADFMVFKMMEEKLRNENFLLRSTIRDRYKFQNIIGDCPAMQEVFDYIVKAATTNDNVFVYGESGTGKELVAHAIHNVSERKSGNFVTVNCAAIPENLIESEFFGTSKGAFTGATTDKKGYLEIADGGTLFLDEIGDISPNLQVKLLRAIDGGGFSPVGSRRVIQPDLRIIAASNKNLEDLMNSGNIRQDFFFRIHVIPIHLPPLRERDDDVLILINHFLKKYSASDSITSLSQEELETLKNHPWPGNVRELQNVIRRYIAMKNLHFMNIQGVSAPTGSPAPYTPDTLDTAQVKEPQDLRTLQFDFERKVILKALESVRWNRTKAARELGVSRKTLFRKMKAYGIE